MPPGRLLWRTPRTGAKGGVGGSRQRHLSRPLHLPSGWCWWQLTLVTSSLHKKTSQVWNLTVDRCLLYLYMDIQMRYLYGEGCAVYRHLGRCSFKSIYLIDCSIKARVQLESEGKIIHSRLFGCGWMGSNMSIQFNYRWEIPEVFFVFREAFQ